MMVAAASVRAAEAPSDKVQIQRTVTDGFTHPGIGLTTEILENARRQILAKREPWFSGFQALAAHPSAARNVTCRNESAAHPGYPDADAFDNKSVEMRLKPDALKAKFQTLMYCFTGDEVFRANAMRIVRVWSRMDPDKYRYYSEAHIHASYPVQDLLMAAELLRYTSAQDATLAWTEEDTRDFTNNFAFPAGNTFQNQNGWFMNQNGYALAAAMSGDIFRNDRGSYAKRVEWFTVNETAPNKGWSSSITDLARRVDTDAVTGEKIDPPVIQLMEMGRDQAHAGGDVEIFMNTARQMQAQGTKVDPRAGTISTAADAVGPYEFLDDRILAAADFYCRFMLGHETPWVPAPIDIAPDGKVVAIYPRIADNYRGRIRGLDFWDMEYHYAYVRGIDMAKKAPYYHEAFTKRIVNSPTDWIYIPAAVTGEAARVAPREQEPAVITVAQRSTLFTDKATIVSEGPVEFVRVSPASEGTKIAILSAATDRKTVAWRVRTDGVAEATMSGIAGALLLPDTRGEWRYVTTRIGKFETFRDIEYLTVKGSLTTVVDIEKLVRIDAEKLGAPEFRPAARDERLVGYVGAPLTADFPAAGSKGKTVFRGLDLPPGANLDSGTGSFSWRPTQPGNYAFIVVADDGGGAAARRVAISVAGDRATAVQQIVSRFREDTPYAKTTLNKYRESLDAVQALGVGVSDKIFQAKLDRLQEACVGLEPLTPLLPDGSMDYPSLIASSNLGESIGLLTDGNDDTFPVYTLAKELNDIFDFGAGYQVSVSAFAIQSRVNFGNRGQDTALFGSDDGKNWVQLTAPIPEPPVRLTTTAVDAESAARRFRYLKIEKTSRQAAAMFEPSELRLYGQRYEAAP